MKILIPKNNENGFQKEKRGKEDHIHFGYKDYPKQWKERLLY